MKRYDVEPEPFRSHAEIIASNRKRREDMLAELSRKAARAKYNAERCLIEGWGRRMVGAKIIAKRTSVKCGYREGDVLTIAEYSRSGLVYAYNETMPLRYGVRCVAMLPSDYYYAADVIPPKPPEPSRILRVTAVKTYKLFGITVFKRVTREAEE